MSLKQLKGHLRCSDDSFDFRESHKEKFFRPLCPHARDLIFLRRFHFKKSLPCIFVRQNIFPQSLKVASHAN
jgi:hypothetical protein